MSSPLLAKMLAAAKKDKAMVTTDGRPLVKLIEGVKIRPLPVHVDERGSVCELYDPRWQWHDEPLVFSYFCTIRPGYTKGWNLHKEHEDRYAIIQGDMELVMFDPRPESSTFNQLCRIILSDQNRCIVNVPRFVWHADTNIGTKDVLFINYPTQPYDHANPDKYRLPLDTDLIPFRFENPKGY